VLLLLVALPLSCQGETVGSDPSGGGDGGSAGASASTGGSHGDAGNGASSGGSNGTTGDRTGSNTTGGTSSDSNTSDSGHGGANTGGANTTRTDSGSAGGNAGAAGAAGACDACESSWGEPVRLDYGRINGCQIAMNDAGAAVVGCTSWNGDWGAYHAVAAVYTPSEGWGQNEVIATVETEVVRVAIDDEATVLVLWQEAHPYEERPPNFWTKRYSEFAIHEDAEPVNPDRSVRGELPQLAIAADGSALTVWNEYEAADGLVQSSHYLPGEGWGGAVPIAVATKPLELQLAMNPSGNALVVWRQEAGDSELGTLEETTWSSHGAAGSEWTTPEAIHAEVGQQRNNTDSQESAPDVAIDPQGNGIVVWSQFTDESWKVWTNRFDASEGWEGAELLSTAPLDATHPSLDMDADGNAVAIWAQSASSDCGVWSRRYTPASGWADPELIGPRGGPCFALKIAVGAAGDAVAVWSQFGDYRSNRYTPGVGWSEAEVFVDVDVADVAVDGHGNAMAVLRRDYPEADETNLLISTSTRPR